MPSDLLVSLQASQTITSSFTTAGTAVVLPAGTPRRGLKARVIYSAATQASGSGVWTFSLAISYDGGSTYVQDYVETSQAITLTTTAQQGEFFIPFEISPTSVANGTRVKLYATLSGSPATPTITYSGDILLGRP
jgi:hypothetical protein